MLSPRAGAGLLAVAVELRAREAQRVLRIGLADGIGDQRQLGDTGWSCQAALALKTSRCAALWSR